MDISEKTALLNYLEFGLLTFCDQITSHIPSDKHEILYEKAYKLLVDIDDTLDMHITTSQDP